MADKPFSTARWAGKGELLEDLCCGFQKF